MTLNLEPNIKNPDAFLDALLEAHAELTPEASQDFNARLILILANHIGSKEVLEAALKAAK